MLTKLKNIANTEDKKRLLSNFFSLSVLQGANYILPLLTLPYLVRVLGVEHFGLLAFATAMIAYFNIITDYGFNLTATREISIHREDKEKVIEIFSSVMSIKFVLMIVSFLLLSILVFSFEKFSQNWEVYFLTFGTVVGQVLFPVWFFQGMERMKYITYLNILAKSIFTVAIFIFVQEQSDFWIVPLLTSIGFIIAGIWSLFLVKKEFGIGFEFQKVGIIRYYLVDGWNVFLQQLYVSMYGNINIILLGLFTNNTIVGYYSLVEKILSIPVSLFTILTQTYYPYGVTKFQNNVKDYFKQLKKISIFFVFISIFFIFLFFTFGGLIISIITGVDNNNIIIQIFNVLVFGIIFSAFGSFYTQIFVTLNESIVLNKVSFLTMIVNLLFAPFVIYIYGVVGLAFFTVFRQFSVISICSILIRKIKLKLLKG